MSEPTLEQRLDVLERQMLSLRREVRELSKWLYILSSPPWKRLLWFFQGWHLWSLGRWYRKG